MGGFQGDRPLTWRTPEQTLSLQLDSTSPYLYVNSRPFSRDDPGFKNNASSTFNDKDDAKPSSGPALLESVWATDKVSVGNESREDTLLSTPERLQADCAVFSDKASAPDSWGFAFPSQRFNHSSFWHTSSANWTDKQLGLFLSRHREDPKDTAGQPNSYSWKDSELVIGLVFRV